MSEQQPTRGTVVSVVTIRGMVAVHAVRAVFTALAGVEGISRADVELGRATVEHDGRATPERLREAIALAGCAVESVVEERRRLPLLDG